MRGINHTEYKYQTEKRECYITQIDRNWGHTRKPKIERGETEAAMLHEWQNEASCCAIYMKRNTMDVGYLKMNVLINHKKDTSATASIGSIPPVMEFGAEITI